MQFIYEKLSGKKIFPGAITDHIVPEHHKKGFRADDSKRHQFSPQGAENYAVPIKIIAIQTDKTVVINYGDSVLIVGDKLKIFEQGASFKDPDTGQIVGTEKKETGLLQVIETAPWFSKAKILSGAPKVGGVAKRFSSVQTDATPTSHEHQ
jgi:hypothetical protein